MMFSAERNISLACLTMSCCAATATITSDRTLFKFASASRSFASAARMSGLFFIASAMIDSRLSTAGFGFSPTLAGGLGFMGGVCWPSSGVEMTRDKISTLRIRIAVSPIGFEFRQEPIVGGRVARLGERGVEVQGVAIAAQRRVPVVEAAAIKPAGFQKKSRSQSRRPARRPIPVDEVTSAVAAVPAVSPQPVDRQRRFPPRAWVV